MSTRSLGHHAGGEPGPERPAVPEPTYAERARTLLYIGRVGSLSTVSRRHPAWPFGSVMPYGLDPLGREEMLELIDRIHRQLGILVVLSSHILDDVERVCDYVVVLNGGHVVASQPLHVPDEDTADLHVRVDGDPGPFLQRLHEFGIVARPAGIEYMTDEFVVRRDGDRTLDAIRDAAAASGAPLRLLRPATRSLEDLYVDSVGSGGANARGDRA